MIRLHKRETKALRLQRANRTVDDPEIRFLKIKIKHSVELHKYSTPFVKASAISGSVKLVPRILLGSYEPKTTIKVPAKSNKQ